MRIRLGQKGFSLLEILIALGIFAGSIGMLVGSINYAKRTQLRDDAMLKGVWLANNKMAELQARIDADLAKNKFPDQETGSEKFEGEFEDYEWSYEIRKVEIPLSMDNLPGAGGGEEGGGANAMKGVLQQIVKDISDSVREVKVVVTWPDIEDDKPRDVKLTTHVVRFK